MCAVKSLACTYTYSIIKFFNLTADFFQFGCSCFQMFRDNILNGNITTGCCSCEHKCSGFNLIRDDGIFSTVKFLNTFDTYNICTCTFDVGAHAVQEVRNINDMRLSCCILNDRTS